MYEGSYHERKLRASVRSYIHEDLQIRLLTFFCSIVLGYTRSTATFAFVPRYCHYRCISIRCIIIVVAINRNERIKETSKEIDR